MLAYDASDVNIDFVLPDRRKGASLSLTFSIDPGTNRHVSASADRATESNKSGECVSKNEERRISGDGL